MFNPFPITDPFKKIALSLSGGGYRAAAFHLGTMSFLNEVTFKSKPLLEQVKIISTVSGGTITGVCYAIGKKEGQSFGEIYQFIMHHLASLDLITEGLQHLNPNAKWDNPRKHKNLINAFSELYDKYLTKGRTLGDLTRTGHLEALFFNGTEFSNGINFRFKNQKSGYSGNFTMKVQKETAREIKLSDVLASSSCFPGGFEPLAWPHDFVHDQSPRLEALAKDADPVGIMDGGIYDNQGIDSILLYEGNKRRALKNAAGTDKELPPYFDLVIISDVASPYMAAYKPFDERPKKGLYKKTVGELKSKVRNLHRATTIAMVLTIAALLLLPLLWGYKNNILTGILLTLAVITSLILCLTIFLGRFVKNKLAEIPGYLRSNFHSFYVDRLQALNVDALSLHRLEPLIMDRLNSVMTLLSNVFLKVVRRLNYNNLYEDSDFQYRRISNLIWELTQTDFEKKNAIKSEDDEVEGELTTQGPEANKQAAKEPSDSQFDGRYDDVVGSKIGDVAQRAANFGTTLWFTEEEKDAKRLDDLVAAGQFTMCYNLIIYLEKLIKDEESGYLQLATKEQNAIQEVLTQCQAAWNLFYKDPFHLL